MAHTARRTVLCLYSNSMLDDNHKGFEMSESNTGERTLPLGLNLGIWDRMTSWEEVIEIARLADELGYDCLLIPESFGRDGVTLCDRLLAATRRIKVCFGIANVFSRSPAVLASTAATLDELSGGRFVLGLGGSTPNLVEGWHGLEFKTPLARTRETVAICHKIWARDPSPFEGEIFRTGGVKLAFKPLRDKIPIWQGAVLEKGLQACGEAADGWIPANLPGECISWGRAVIAQSATAAGRDSAQITIAPTFQLAIHEDAQQVMPLDCPGGDPDQVSRRGGVDADVSVGPDLVAERGHFLFALVTQHDDGFLGAACPIALDQFHGVELTRLVANQHGVERLVSQSRYPVGHTDRFLQHDLRRTIGGKRLGQPSAGPLPRGDIQHPHHRRHPKPGRRRHFRGGHALLERNTHRIGP
jgi:alkanesulfonate monooxygenase SsuD/methylene tetrahydromethanopterin reductase-like flavin-dependent oxidoreductase (luciferase family)